MVQAEIERILRVCIQEYDVQISESDPNMSVLLGIFSLRDTDLGIPDGRETGEAVYPAAASADHGQLPGNLRRGGLSRERALRGQGSGVPALCSQTTRCMWKKRRS